MVIFSHFNPFNSKCKFKLTSCHYYIFPLISSHFLVIDPLSPPYLHLGSAIKSSSFKTTTSWANPLFRDSSICRLALVGWGSHPILLPLLVILLNHLLLLSTRASIEWVSTYLGVPNTIPPIAFRLHLAQLCLQLSAAVTQPLSDLRGKMLLQPLDRFQQRVIRETRDVRTLQRRHGDDFDFQRRTVVPRLGENRLPVNLYRLLPHLRPGGGLPVYVSVRTIEEEQNCKRKLVFTNDLINNQSFPKN